MPKRLISTPLGFMLAAEEEGFLTALDFIQAEDARGPFEETPLLLNLQRELEEYFAGRLREFTVPVRLKGTGFQRAVWDRLLLIPYGQTATYGQVAKEIGLPKACRAVGQANHVNPVSILVPCHRVVGADGKLTGYGGGLERKEALLKLESKP